MGARVISLVKDRHDSGPFSLSWRGYDRAEVDAFLERTAADRKRLQADLAQLEAALSGRNAGKQEEVERLGALRSELARCLETSINALHLANLLLVSPDAADRPASAPSRLTGSKHSEGSRPVRWPLPAWLSPARTLVLIGGMSAAIVIVPTVANGPALADQPPAITPAAAPLVAAPPPEAAPPVSQVAIPEPLAESPSAAAQPAPLPPLADDLVLTLTATGPCWLSSAVDGAEPRERLLEAGESITLRATGEAVLRVGDPAALLLSINDRPARPLGTAGRVVTARITTSNYLNFLVGG